MSPASGDTHGRGPVPKPSVTATRSTGCTSAWCWRKGGKRWSARCSSATPRPTRCWSSWCEVRCPRPNTRSSCCCRRPTAPRRWCWALLRWTPAPPSARATTSSKGAICAAIATAGCSDVGSVKAATKAGTGCGGCVPLVAQLLKHELTAAGVAVNNRAVRALRLQPPGAVRPGARRADHDLRRAARRARPGPRAARSASRRWRRSWRRMEQSTSSTASRRRCRTPTTASWPTSSATAPTRWCRASRAARSPRTS